MKTKAIWPIFTSRSPAGDLTVIYTPARATLQIRMDRLHPSVQPRWYDPRTGEWHSAIPDAGEGCYSTPAQGDWVWVTQAPLRD